MNKQKLWLCDEDENYVLRLSKYINDQQELPFTAQPYTDPEILLAKRRGSGAGILVISESLLGTQRTEVTEELLTGSGRCFVLAEALPSPFEEEWRERRKGKVFFLNKFISAAELIRQILRQKEDVRPGHSDVVGVYSPVGRCGKSAFAVALGEILGQSRRVLYVNLEEYSWIIMEEGDEDGAGEKATLSDLMYEFGAAVDKGETQMQAWLQNVFPDRVRECTGTWRHLDYLCPPGCGEDIGDIGIEEWEEFVRALCKCTGYETIILDIGPQLRDVPRLLLQCGRIYVPILGDECCTVKLRRFERSLYAAGAGELTERIRPLSLPIPERIDPYSPETLADTQLGRFVRNLLEEEKRR